jgi:FAD:protein FMN transferase
MLMLNQKLAQRTHFGMGTVMSHKAYGMYTEDCLDAVCREISQLEYLLSRFIPDSEVSRINQNAGELSLPVSPETFDVLTRSLELSAVCRGSFDITIAPLVALWNIGKVTFQLPSESEIQKVLSLVNYHDLILDSENCRVGLNKPGQSIDLGGVGKGFAGDRILDIYRSFGVSSAYSNLGGNVVTLGVKPDGSPWHIGIQHPRQEDQLLGMVSIIDQSVVTSGDYQRYSRNSSGNHYQHILDPDTGYPAESGLISVTIVTENSITADALSTAILVKGISEGFELLKCFAETEAILVDAEEQVFITKGLSDHFQPGDGIQFTVLE